MVEQIPIPRSLPSAPEPSAFIDLLNRQHFAPIEFSMTGEQLSDAGDRFLDFLALPDAVKRQLHFPARSHRASADGYTDKSSVERKDPKQFFHWSPGLSDQPIYRELRDAHPEIAAFFQCAETIYQHIERALLHLFSHELAEYKDRIFRDDHLVDGILRFLSYRPRPEHGFCARAHFDKGFSTLALADSAPGLRIGCCDSHPLQAVEYGNGTALFMPAWMLFQASGGMIKPAWHDVVHSPSTQNVNDLCARWSIVFFINAPGTPFSSWDEVHTPLH